MSLLYFPLRDQTTSWRNVIGVVAMKLLKVASQSNPNSVAGGIAGALEQDAAVEMHPIGACPVNQSVKAIAKRLIAQKDSSVPLKAIPGFIELEIASRDRTGMQFIIDK